jgi:hypothetical protein
MCLGGQSLGYNIVIQSNTNKHLNPLDKQFLLHSTATTTAAVVYLVCMSHYTLLWRIICLCPNHRLSYLTQCAAWLFYLQSTLKQRSECTFCYYYNLFLFYIQKHTHTHTFIMRTYTLANLYEIVIVNFVKRYLMLNLFSFNRPSSNWTTISRYRWCIRKIVQLNNVLNFVEKRYRK